MNLPSKLTSQLNAWGLPAGATWLVAVSGGLDSTCLLNLLRAAGVGGLHVVHLNHGLRGAESDADEAFVEYAAERLGLPCTTRREEVSERARERGISLELAGRELRQEFFAETSGNLGASGVFLGHHADDQAETVLWNLLRGASTHGASGIRPRSELRVGEREVTLLRPLLQFTRAELREYAFESGLAWREDASNADPAAATRNCLRQDMLPLLEQRLGRSVAVSLTRFAEISRAEDEFMQAQAEALDLHQGEALDVRALAELPLALQRRVLHAWLKGRGCALVGFQEVEAVRGLLAVGEAGHGRPRVNLPGNAIVRRTRMQLMVSHPEEAAGRGNSR